MAVRSLAGRRYHQERTPFGQFYKRNHLEAKQFRRGKVFLLNCVIRRSLTHFVPPKALAHRLAVKLSGTFGDIVNFDFLLGVFLECLHLSRADNDIEKLALLDLIAVEQRDPACRSVVSVFLYFKGYKAIQAYRMAHVLWKNDRKDLAMLIQARCSEIFGIDIHPGAVIGGGLMIDHGTGVVIGETSVIGNGCTFLHGVTLGGTGKSSAFNRHPHLGNYKKKML